MRRPFLVGLLLAATALRAAPLTDNRFHPDEALYATFARLIATGRDPWLASEIVDKPPLPFYLTAGAMTLLGPKELAARLPNLFASLLSLPLLYALGRRLYGQPTGMLAMLLLALAPFAISFSPTAFLDPLHTAVLLWAALAAAAGMAGWAGLAAGLALSVKQTTLAFLPLLVWMLWGRQVGWRTRLRSVGVFLGWVALAVVAITAWDLARHPPISFWAQGYSDNMAGRLAYPSELLPRLGELARLLSYASACLSLDALVGMGLVGLAFSWRGEPPQARRHDVTLAGFVLAFLAAYWLGTFNLWDRYFLVLIPIMCLLAARGLLWLADWAVAALAPRLSVTPLMLAGACTVIFLTPPAVTAAHSGFPIGSDHGAYDGIDQVAEYLAAIPKGAVLYDHWLSWELRYYLDDAPIYLVWMPDPATLTTDLRAFGRTSPRYFVSPSWEADDEYQEAATLAGFTFEAAYTTRRRDGAVSFVVYRLVAAGG